MLLETVNKKAYTSLLKLCYFSLLNNTTVWMLIQLYNCFSIINRFVICIFNWNLRGLYSDYCYSNY